MSETATDEENAASEQDENLQSAEAADATQPEQQEALAALTGLAQQQEEPAADEPRLKFKIDKEEVELPYSEVQKRLAAAKSFDEVAAERKELEAIQANLGTAVEQEVSARQQEILNQIRERLPNMIEQRAQQLAELSVLPPEQQQRKMEAQQLQQLQQQLETLQNDKQNTQQEYQDMLLKTHVDAFINQAQVSDPELRAAFVRNLCILQDDGCDVGAQGIVDYNELLKLTHEQETARFGNRLKDMSGEALVKALGQEKLIELAKTMAAAKQLSATTPTMQTTYQHPRTVSDDEAGKGDIVL